MSGLLRSDPAKLPRRKSGITPNERVLLRHPVISPFRCLGVLPVAVENTIENNVPSGTAMPINDGHITLIDHCTTTWRLQSTAALAGTAVSRSLAGADSPGSGHDGRTTRYSEYGVSQGKRKRIEEGFGWLKTVALQRKTKFRSTERVGWMFTLAAA